MASSQHEILLSDLKEPNTSSKAQPQSGISRSPSLWAKLVKNGWLVEVLSVAIGTAAIIALCSLLNHYNGKPAPRANAIAGVDITFNTVVSILSTIGKAALLLSVSECISQSKWHWYLDRHRPLDDLDTFDKASRGAWGGLQLLWKVNIRQIASVGALLMVVSLAVDPLSQQLVHYRVDRATGPLGSALLPIATDWSDIGDSQDIDVYVGSINSFDTTPYPPLPMRGAIQNGLLSQNSAIPDLQPPCSSGNCTWPSYRSLAICARYANVTSSLKSRNVSVPSDFPGGPRGEQVQWYLSEQNLIMDTGLAVFNFSSVAKRNPIMSIAADSSPSQAIALNFTDSVAFKDSALPIADVFMIYTTSKDSSGSDPAAFSAFEFVLEWCVQDFTTVVTNGSSNTQRQNSFRNFSTPDPHEPFESLEAKPNDGDQRTYSVESSTHYNFQIYLRNIFQGTANQTFDGNLEVTNDATQAFFQPFNVFGKTTNGTDQVPGRGAGPSGLQTILDNIAAGMTNMIRTNDNETVAPGDPAPLTVQGTADHQETYVVVQWGWIAAPIVLLIGSVIFFLSAIISSSGLGRRQKPEVWKSSSLPLLKALSAELHQESFGGMRTVSTMEDWAEGVPVRLERSADGAGWKLVRSWDGGVKDGNDDI